MLIKMMIPISQDFATLGYWSTVLGHIRSLGCVVDDSRTGYDLIDTVDDWVGIQLCVYLADRKIEHKVLDREQTWGGLL
jgi:hypothetical protein